MNTTSHEREGGTTCERQWLARVVGDDENWVMKRWIVSPPTVPRRDSIPGPGMSAKHITSHDRGTDI